MTTRGGRGWAGEKSKRFMMVGTKDNTPVGAKTGVVAPVPINTPSLRQETHGSQGDNAAMSSINRSSAGGWGSAAGVSSVSAGSATDQSVVSGKARGRVDGGSRAQGGDDVFTRHFPDLRAGLEQAEKLDAVSKASSKVAPLRKPKPEPSRGQGPSLRPRAMLKPTGSAGGGSAATAAAQAAIADAVHNRVVPAPKVEETRRPVPSFADEISTKSRWSERPPSQEGGTKGRGGGKDAEGRSGGKMTWGTNREAGRAGGKPGRGFDRGERGGRGAFQDKDRRHVRQNSDRGANNNSRARESIYGSGSHVGAVNSSQDGTNSAGTKAPTSTYVRQHGPPPRKAAVPVSTPTQQEEPPATQRPTTSSSHSSTRGDHQPDTDPWNTSTEPSSKWPSSSPSSAEQSPDPPAEAPPAFHSTSSSSTSYVRTHGPPRRSSREGQADEQGEGLSSSTRPDHDAVGDHDAGGEATSRFGDSWGALEQGHGTIDRDSVGGGERTLSGRWKEPASSLAPPPAPTSNRWKEPKEEPRAGPSRGKTRDEGHMGSGRWRREDNGDADNNGVVAPAVSSSPSQSGSWRADDGWGLEGGEHARRDTEVTPTAATSEQVEQQHSPDADEDVALGVAAGITAPPENTADAVVVPADASAPSTAPSEDISPDDAASFRGSFAQQQQAQSGICTPSWEPQLPRGGDLWDNPGHGRESLPQQQGQGHVAPSAPGGASQPWGDPWGTSGFRLSGNQGSNTMASFLGNEPDERRKERYLPPALRNRAPSEGTQGDSAATSSVEQETETNPPSLPEVAVVDVPPQDLAMPGGGGGIGASSPGGTGVVKAPLYEQPQPPPPPPPPPQPQSHPQPQQQQQPQMPLEEWQQRGAQAPHRAQQGETGRPVEQQLHQRHPIHQPHQGQPAQPLHLHHPHLDHGYQRNPAEGFSSFQQQDRHKHQMQEPAVHHQFPSEAFGTPSYHAQHQTGRAPLPEHLHRPQFHSDHVQRQHFNQVQMQPQMHAQQPRIQHSLHQRHQQQQPPQRQPQQQQQSQQQQQQQQQQGHQQLPPGPLGNPAAHASQHLHQQDIGRQTSPAQIHIQQQQQQQQQMQHSSSTFMMPAQGMGYADPRGGVRGGGLGGLPVQMPGSYRDVPPQHQSEMRPSATYGFQSPEPPRKR